MIINHNMGAMNANRNMNINAGAANKSMQKLSSGLRINSAADDAAGLAISEKMRGQIRGLDQASSNAQGGISMVQTAEGALSETQSILQRMRELAVQSGNDTNVGVDRTEIQKEMNQLSSEINRIGNTTEFNTKALLKGDGNSNLTASSLFSTSVSQTGTNTVKTQATATITLSTAAAVDTDEVKISLNGIELTATFVANDSGLEDSEAFSVTSATASINIAGTADEVTSGDGLANALQSMIDKNEVLKGNYTAVSDGAGVVTITAVEGGAFDGAAGSISGYDESGVTTAGNFTEVVTDAVGTTTAATSATSNLDFSATGLNIDSKAKVEALVDKGFTINGQQVEFYNANDGAYTGNAIGINVSDAIAATANFDDALANTVSTQLNTKVEGISAAATGAATGIIKVDTEATGASASLAIKDGGVQKSFEATLQVGANMGQGFKVDINDMRAAALVVTGTAGGDATEGAKFTATNSVSNGTDSTLREAALDVSSYENATAAVKVLNNAIESVSSERSKLGAFQNRLEHTIANLGTSSENLTSAESRIRDVDMAKEMSTFSKNNILSQAAQAMLAQANQQPQQVLQLLR